MGWQAWPVSRRKKDHCRAASLLTVQTLCRRVHRTSFLQAIAARRTDPGHRTLHQSKMRGYSGSKYAPLARPRQVEAPLLCSYRRRDSLVRRIHKSSTESPTPGSCHTCRTIQKRKKNKIGRHRENPSPWHTASTRVHPLQPRSKQHETQICSDLRSRWPRICTFVGPNCTVQ